MIISQTLHCGTSERKDASDENVYRFGCMKVIVEDVLQSKEFAERLNGREVCGYVGH